jgi:type I restriction enzyme, S subunit
VTLIPHGWEWTTLGQIASIKGGLTKGKKRKTGEHVRSVPYLRVANVQRGHIDLTEVKEIEATESEIAVLQLREGDVLLNEGGDRDKLGRGWVWSGQLPLCIHQNHVFRARLDLNTVDPKFVSHYANSNGAEYFYKHGKHTTNLASINLTLLGQLPLPLPPLTEQRRIVAEIEKQFTRLDVAVAGLRRAKAKLLRSRASILATVCGTRCAPIKPGWRLARVGEVGEVKLGRQRSPRHHRGKHMRPYLRVANVFDDRIDIGDVLEMNFTPAEFRTFQLRCGDVLLNEGQSLELVGRAAIFQGEIEGACFQNTLIRFRAGELIKPRYALSVFRSWLYSGRFREVARWTTNIAHLGASRFAEMTIPVPPLSEQEVILSEVEARLSQVKAVEDSIDHCLRRAARLRQSILNAAFLGRLVELEDGSHV